MVKEAEIKKLIANGCIVNDRTVGMTDNTKIVYDLEICRSSVELLDCIRCEVQLTGVVDSTIDDFEKFVANHSNKTAIIKVEDRILLEKAIKLALELVYSLVTSNNVLELLKSNSEFELQFNQLILSIFIASNNISSFIRRNINYWVLHDEIEDVDRFRTECINFKNISMKYQHKVKEVLCI